ncbi:T7SS effector LXG polymorphic toxin [Psychrobacillus sp. FSL K6-2836]|uniref:T7SS effector LXG polymorphic toxin n=1 Tax=Psychrobacillus sp. FSL K6-2836 TaxID=2921548 RepID=UPI0030F599BD
MKILDVDLVQDGLRRNISMLDRLESEVDAIRRAVEGLVAMEDELKGEGGSAIRAFYAECHLPLLKQFLVSAAGYKQVLQQMESALYTLEPDTSGHIVEQFLESEVEQGLSTIAQLTENLTNESNSIMDQVSDIVALPHLNDSEVQEGVLNAKRKRDDTVSTLLEFDATQTAALLPFEQDMQAMDMWIHNMEEMFTSNLTDIHFQTDRWAELVACNRPLTITTPTIEGEMCLREEEEEKSIVDTGLEIVDGILSGLFDVGKDFVTGIVDIVQDPKATLEATVEAVTNPMETFNTIKSAITTSYERDMVNGDANSRAHWVTYALGTVATSVVGTKGVGALTKSGVTVTKAVVPKVVGAANNASDSLANLLPYGPRTQFAIAGEVPYNTVNATGLRDQVTSIVRVESGVKGTGDTKTKNINKEKFENAMVEAVRNQPPYTRKPNKPRNFKSKVRNEDGTTTYTFISKKNEKEYNVAYDKKGFPIFNTKHEISLPEKLYLETDAVQFEYLSKSLYKEIKGNPELATKFTKQEIELLEAGKVPQTLTWHHNQQPGEMQIVDYFEHQSASHTGGRAIWGGGEAGRKGEIKKQILEMISWD